MDSVSFERFEAARLMAQSRLSQMKNHVPAQRVQAGTAEAQGNRQVDWKSVLEAKKMEIEGDASSISKINRNTKTEETASISGMFKNLGRIANHYMAHQLNETDLAQTPKKKMLGNYIDISV